MVENEPITSDGIFDVAQAFKDMNSKFESMTATITSLQTKMDAEPTTPEKPEEETEETKTLKEKIAGYESKEKEAVLAELSEVQGNDGLKAELSDFSVDHLKKLVDMSKNKTVNFSKTNKGPENGADDSKKIEELEAKIINFSKAGLKTESVQAELDSLKDGK